MSDFQRDVVVVPLDFSDASEKALKTALDLTGDVNKLRLLHVLPPLEAISPAVVWGELSNATREQSVKTYAKKFLEKLGIPLTPIELRIGNPGYEITEFAKQQNADLIVVSSHGYHGIKRILLGSVAESVIRHAHCAVLVLRRQDAK